MLAALAVALLSRTGPSPRRWLDSTGGHQGSFTTSQGEAMSCGVLAFLHIGKTGGASITQHLRHQAHQANFTPYEVWWGNVPSWHRNQYDYSKDPVWVDFRKHAYGQEKPKITLALHHGVPGIGRYMWEEELKPLAQKLHTKGCELRITTVLRDAEDRAMSNFNYDVDLKLKRLNINTNMNTLGFDCQITSMQASPSDDCICSYVSKEVSSQVTTVLFGHLPQSVQHPDESIPHLEGIPNQTDARNPLAHLAMSVTSLSSVWSQSAADVLDHTMYTVGCTESLPDFAAALDDMLGVERFELKHENPTDYSATLSDVGAACVQKANQADSELYSRFCDSAGKSKRRGAAGREPRRPSR
jgi:hypothetical protein